MKSNIGRVFVGGELVSQYFDLDVVPEWDALTDAGNRYRVVAVGPSGSRYHQWVVYEIAEANAELGASVGAVRRSGHIYQYSHNGVFLFPDRQEDLCNAVQGLTI